MGGRLAGRVAVVTGGASGIGHAIAKGFDQEGAQVIVADVSKARCEAACREIGARAVPQVLDVRDRRSIDAMVDGAKHAAGRIDILVNCAGVFGMQMLIDATLDEFDRVMSVNTRGPLLTMAAVAREMIEDGRGGAIVNIASGAGRRGTPGAGIYAASKAALISLTQTAAQELIAHGIRVNAIAPGPVRTPMWDEVRSLYRATFGPEVDVDQMQIAAVPAGRMAIPDDYVGAAIFLAAPESSYIIGQTLNIDGGMYMS
jgi:D-sorbitol dehydrogenase (acceptor)